MNKHIYLLINNYIIEKNKLCNNIITKSFIEIINNKFESLKVI